jgi:hypothetical protein
MAGLETALDIDRYTSILRNVTNDQCLLAKIEGKIYANTEKFEVLRKTLVSRMEIHPARTGAFKKEIRANIDMHQENMEAAIPSIPSEIEETIISSGRRPVVCRPKDGGPPQGNSRKDETQVD